MKKRDILITFDYELFLGSRSGSVQKCLLEPTERIISLFDKYQIKNAIFFIDTVYLIRLREQVAIACKKDYELIVSQIRKLKSKGHYIFPHIHPHWLDAVYNDDSNQWSLQNYSKYRFHHTSQKEKEFLFHESINILKEINGVDDLTNQLIGYRAGGWSIQPFSDFKPFFEQYGIISDFSVVPGFKNLSDAQYFDFRNCPNKNIYKFTDNPLIVVENGKFTEYAISKLKITTPLYWLGKIWGKYLWKTGQRSLGDGSGLVIKEVGTNKGKNDLLGSENEEMISIELLTKVKLPYYKKFLVDNDYMHFISHPKMLSLHNISTFENFLKFAKTKFVLQTDFSQMKF